MELLLVKHFDFGFIGIDGSKYVMPKKQKFSTGSRCMMIDGLDCYIASAVGCWTASGPWKILSRMRIDRQTIRPWVVAMSGIIITTDLTDVQAATEAISPRAWSDRKYPYRALLPTELKRMARRIVKNVENSIAETQKAANEAI